MSGSDTAAEVLQENGPVETREVTDIQTTTTTTTTTTEVVTVKVSSDDCGKGDDDELTEMENHDGGNENATVTKVKDVSNDDNIPSNVEMSKVESKELIIVKEIKEDVKSDGEVVVSVIEETEVTITTTNNSNSEETQEETKTIECNEEKNDSSENKEEVLEAPDDNQGMETPKPAEGKGRGRGDFSFNYDDTDDDPESTPKSRLSLRRSIGSNNNSLREAKDEAVPAKRGRRSKVIKPTSTPRGPSKAEEEKAEESDGGDVELMEVGEDVEEEVKTPRRGKRVSQKATPAVVENKRKGTKRKNPDEPKKDGKKAKSDDDAYNIDNLDEHPEIGDSFKVERQSNGGAKFLATSNHRKGRFSEIEKAAKERNVESPQGENEGGVGSTGKKSISLLTLNDKRLVSQINDGDENEDGGKESKKKLPKTLKPSVKTPNSVIKASKATPKSTAKASTKSTPKSAAKTPAAKTAPSSVKEADVSTFTIPEMTEDTQFEADTNFESGYVNQYARVYAFYSGICYAAVTTGKSTVSSFEVQFLDDKVMKYIARGGIYRLQELATGLEVEFMDGENTFEGVIKTVPDSTKASDFYKAKFVVERKDDDGKTSDVVVNWDKIILDKSVLKNLKNVEAEIKSLGKTPKKRN